MMFMYFIPCICRMDTHNCLRWYLVVDLQTQEPNSAEQHFYKRVRFYNVNINVDYTT